jgi:hypothetical protein
VISEFPGDGEKADEKPTRRAVEEVLFEWEPGGSPNDRVAIRRGDVLFGFKAGALKPRKLSNGREEWQLDVEWKDDPRLRGRYVFLRTRNAIVRTKWKSIKAAMASLRRLPVFRTHHGTFVNLDAVGPLNFGKTRKWLGFRVGDQRTSKVEWVALSRRRKRRL